MVCCALAVSRGTWWTFSRKRCPASVSGRGSAQEIQIEAAGLGHAEGRGQKELGRVAHRQENGHAIHQQRPRQAIDHRTQHPVQIGFRAQLAPKFDQRLAVVVAGAIEELIDTLLDPFAHRVKEQRGDHHGQDQPDRSRTRDLGVDQFRDSSHYREVNPDNRGRRQRVHHAPLENQVHVHQPVAEDGISEGQGQQAQRQNGNLHRRARHRSRQIGNHIEQREGRDGQNGAARDPFELLPQDRRAGPAIAVPQHRRRDHEEQGQVAHLHPVEVPAHPLGGFQYPEREDVYSQQQHPGHVNGGNDPAILADKGALLREGQDEMQEQCGLKQPCRNVAPVDNPVKLVQLSGELEGVKDERDQAENIEMRGTRRRPASQQNIKPDPQIDQGDEPKPVVQRAFGGNQDDGRVQRDRLPNQGVSRLRPRAHAVNLPHPGGGVLYVVLVDGDQLITGSNPGLLARAVRLHPVGDQASLASGLLHPPDAIRRNLELGFFLEIDPGQNDRGRGQKNQQTGCKADLEVPVHRPQRLLVEGGGKTRRMVKHVGGHGRAQGRTSNSLQRKDFTDYRSAVEVKLRFLEGFCGVW